MNHSESVTQALYAPAQRAACQQSGGPGAGYDARRGDGRHRSARPSLLRAARPGNRYGLDGPLYWDGEEFRTHGSLACGPARRRATPSRCCWTRAPIPPQSLRAFSRMASALYSLEEKEAEAQDACTGRRAPERPPRRRQRRMPGLLISKSAALQRGARRCFRRFVHLKRPGNLSGLLALRAAIALQAGGLLKGPPGLFRGGAARWPWWTETKASAAGRGGRHGAGYSQRHFRASRKARAPPPRPPAGALPQTQGKKANPKRVWQNKYAADKQGPMPRLNAGRSGPRQATSRGKASLRRRACDVRGIKSVREIHTRRAPLEICAEATLHRAGTSRLKRAGAGGPPPKGGFAHSFFRFFLTGAKGRLRKASLLASTPLPAGRCAALAWQL